ncbi:Hypothetical_protein [Hexamita inflata]|uniref:Hypothetical_protein n=1 Tax=Hexamita inflata TaxID=28002 RepID=A0AA86QLM3_9EUKA|nr:Hypothetical protein HINF_LOCUS44243 [Hexamita inflata]
MKLKEGRDTNTQVAVLKTCLLISSSAILKYYIFIVCEKQQTSCFRDHSQQSTSMKNRATMKEDLVAQTMGSSSFCSYVHYSHSVSESNFQIAISSYIKLLK